MQPYPPQQPPRANAAQKATAWSAGLIALVIVGPIVLIALCCIGCFMSGTLGTIFSPDAASTP